MSKYVLLSSYSPVLLFLHIPPPGISFKMSMIHEPQRRIEDSLTTSNSKLKKENLSDTDPRRKNELS
jgi:hypothetical protein